MGSAYGHTNNVAYFKNQLSPDARDFNSRDTDWHLYQVTVSQLHVGNAWKDSVKVTNNKGASSHDNRKPKRIYFGGNTPDQCQIAEFAIFNRVVPESERLKIEGYLARKWGLMNTMFTAAHPYYTSDPYEPTVTQGGEDAAVTFYWGDDVKQGTTTLNFATGQADNDDLSSTFGSNLSSATNGATVTLSLIHISEPTRPY